MRWRIGLAAFLTPVMIVLAAGAQAEAPYLVSAVVEQVATVTMR
jgi:hypothetical protein